MFLRKAASFLLLMTFLAVAHDIESGGTKISLAMAVIEIVLFVGYMADVTDDFIRFRDTSRKLRNYLWLGIPVGVQVFAIGMPYAQTIAVVWVTGIVLIITLKLITGGRMTGNSNKIADGILSSGMPLG